MSAPARAALAQEIARSMRSALARTELAAGRLARDAATPRARRLAHSISSAVTDLDRALEDLVALVAGAPRIARDEDLAAVLHALRERYAPVLAARGIEWVDAPASGPPPRGDAALARRAVALMLRVGTANAYGGGRIALAASTDAGAWWIGIEVEPAGGGAARPSRALAELRAFASRSHATLDQVERGGCTTLRLRFAGEVAA